MAESHKNQEHTCQYCRNDQTIQSVSCHNSCHDRRKGCSRTSNLHTAPSQCGDHKSRYNSRKIPASGPTPDASASAMDNGSAIIATMIPAVTSLKNCSRLYDFKEVNNIGFKEFIRISISFLSFIHNSLEL